MEKTKMDEEKAEWNTDVERLKESARKEKTKMDEEKAKLKADDEIWKESSKHAKTKKDEAVADKLALKGRLDPVYEHRLQLVEGNEKIREQDKNSKNGAPPLTKGCTDVEHQFGAGEGIR